MVIVSGILAYGSYKRCDNFFKYFEKRIIRLIIPVWIFLTILFLGANIFIILGKKYPFSIKQVFSSYAIIDGIGYVWVIRVYILCALSVPILCKLRENLSKQRYYILMIFMYTLYEICYYYIGNKNLIFTYIVYYIVPYGFICTFIGMELKDWKNKTVLKVSLIVIMIFIILAIGYYNINDKFIIMNEAKYPARLYYLSYGIGVSLLLYYIVDRKNIFKIKEKFNNSVVIFISTHTMWIYLWHILYLYCIQYTYNNMQWIIKFLVILILSILTTYIQSKVVNKLKIKNKTIKYVLDC